MTPEGRERIQRESLIWISLLPHPNIVKALSFEFDGGLPKLMLEYIGGGSLRDLLRKNAPTLHQFLRIATEFCEGMIFLAESDGIVHRDIKPENILLSIEGGVKITDFGLASAFRGSDGRLIGGDSSIRSGRSSQENAEKSFGGTLPYMAPEQFVSFHTADRRADIYGFGVVMYEMLVGRLPFNHTSVDRMMRAHQRASPPPLGQHIPSKLREIVMKCLAKEPSERFESFQALSGRLKDFCRQNGFDTSIAGHYSAEKLEETLDSVDWTRRVYA